MGSSSQHCRYCGEIPCACGDVVQTRENPTAEPHPVDHATPVVLSSTGEHAGWCGCDECNPRRSSEDCTCSGIYTENVGGHASTCPAYTCRKPDTHKTIQNTGGAEPMFFGGSRVGKSGPTTGLDLSDRNTVDDVDTKDSWKHRSQGMRCQTCMAFVTKVGDHPDKPNKLGRCRRHAPVMAGYPAVFENDWCLDHKIDENKI